jgi:DEAD/DEAH box helicase domain-containing protein
MVESEQYYVDKLDLERKTASVHRVESEYYTDAMTYTNVRVIDAFAKKSTDEIIVEHGEVQVVRKVVGYKKIKFYTSENLGYGDVNLPEKDMHTTSYWFTIPRDRLGSLPYNQEQMIDGLAGLSYSLHHISAMMLMADLHDIDRAIGDKSGEWFVRKDRNMRTITTSPGADGGCVPTTEAFDPTIFLYDAYPGGIGFSELLFERHDELLNAARLLIGNCACAAGCPSCVGPVLEVGPGAKETARAILDLLQRKS